MLTNMGESDKAIEMHHGGIPYTGLRRAAFAWLQANVVENMDVDLRRELAINQNPCIRPVHQHR